MNENNIIDIDNHNFNENVIVINIEKMDENAKLPDYADRPKETVGLDLSSCEELTIEPWSTELVDTGIKIELVPGYEGQVRSRSGLALDENIFVLNSPGTIDPGYRGTVGVILANFSNEPFKIDIGDRIGQLVVAEYKRVVWDTESKIEDNTERGERGFGGSGK